ncbi:MAG TPA: hypothetical protein VGL81_29505 [Polyangiaceae bacterium]|jgi:hypothetical protein
MTTSTWPIHNQQGQVVVTVETAAISYLKATGPDSQTRAFQVVEYTVTPGGSRIAAGVHLLVHNVDSAGAALDVWDTGSLEASCSSVTSTVRFREISGSLFDRVDSAPLELTQGSWSSCAQDLNRRATGHLSVAVGPLSSILARATGLAVGTPSESKSASIESLPWAFQGGQRVQAAFTVYTVTYIRATDPASGASVYNMTLEYQDTSNGWFLESGGDMKITTQNAQGGALDVWDAGSANVGCRGTSLTTLTRTISPDTYEQASQAYVEIAAANWTAPIAPCR